MKQDSDAEVRPGWRWRLKALRKRFYEYMPYVKRKSYRRVNSQLKAIHKVLLTLGGSLASHARLQTVLSKHIIQSDELCLFVSYAPGSRLKPHVVDYINALITEDIPVALVVNTDTPVDKFDIPDELKRRLMGFFLRENVGFDFAAWAHLYDLLQPQHNYKRIYLANDSIVGPLDVELFRTVIGRVRDSGADMVGLTENHRPEPHLQSFFLVFNERLLLSKQFQDFMSGVLNLPSKQLVIDCYEKQLTPFLRRLGYTCEALFPNISAEIGFDDETTRNWKRLLERGFPFVKASVLRKFRGDSLLVKKVPSRYFKSEI